MHQALYHVLPICGLNESSYFENSCIGFLKYNKI